DHQGNGTLAYSFISNHLRNPPKSLPLLFQEFFDFDGGHAPCSRSCNRLTVPPVLDIAARVHSMHPREHIVVSLEIALGIHVELTGEHLGVGLMSNSQK